MREAFRWGLVAVMSAGAAGACAGSTRDHMKDLKQSVDAYHTAFRWNNYQQAAMYLPNDLRTAFVTYFDEDSPTMHIEGVEILKVDVKSPDAADVTVRYRYMKLPSVVVQRKIVQQSWHRVDDEWILEHEDPPLVDYTDPPEEDRPEPTSDDADEWSTPETWTPSR